MTLTRNTRIAIAGLAIGLAALGLYALRERDEHDTEPVAKSGTRAKTPRDGWMPWFFDRPGPPGTKPYRGPNVEVRVKVVDLSGSPVAGVRVDAKADPEEYEVAGMTDEEYEAWLEREEAVLGEETELPSEGEEEDWMPIAYETVESGDTDRDGMWTAKLKPEISVVFHAHDDRGREGVSTTVYVYGDDLAAEEMETEEEEDLSVTIEIAEIGVLVGQVVDPRGSPISGADITLTSWSTDDIDSHELMKGPSAIRTADDGRFKVELRASGAFDVEVHAKRFQPVVEQAIQVLPGRETSVSITMMPSAEIAGIVLDPAGRPVPDARVVVQGQPQPGAFVSFETDTDEEGRFVAEELAPGKYVVAASAEGFRPVESWNIDAGSRNELVLRLTRGGAIEGMVIADASLLAQMRAIVRPPDRIFEEAGAEPDLGFETPEASVYFGDVYLAHSGGEDELIPLATGVPRERAAESPSGVVDSRGRYFAQVRVTEDGRGSFSIRGIPAGSYAGTVMLGTAIAHLGNVRVYDSGTTNVTISLPDRSGGTIAGSVRSDDGRAIREGTVFLYGGTLPSGMSALLQAAGRFEFSSVPPGEYMIHAVATVRGVKDDGSEDESAYAPARSVTIALASRTNVDLVLSRESDEPVVEPIEPLDIDDIGDDWGSGGDLVIVDDEPPEDLWAPDVWIEEIEGSLVVTWAPPGPDGKRLFGGDRVVSIDGTNVGSMESWEALELLYGPQGTICTIVADRPATHASVTVGLLRTRPADEI